MNFYNQMKKGAIVAIHFGTTYVETRVKTIDIINDKLKKSFVNLDFYDGFSSRIVNRILAKRGILKLNTSELFEKLIALGYKNVIVQPTYMINGTEMETLKKEVEKYKDKFDDVRVGTPILTSVEDYFTLLSIIDNEKKDLRKNEGIVLVGHGTKHSAHSSYSMLDYIARDLKKPIYIGTVEGYPDCEKVLKQLKEDGIKNITLMPLMLVAGDHAKNDIAVEWKELLEENGYEVQLDLRGLGELEAIQNIFIKKAKTLENIKEEDILKKKLEYSKGREATH